jgi:hypothetical protein
VGLMMMKEYVEPLFVKLAYQPWSIDNDLANSRLTASKTDVEVAAFIRNDSALSLHRYIN